MRDRNSGDGYHLSIDNSKIKVDVINIKEIIGSDRKNCQLPL